MVIHALFENELISSYSKLKYRPSFAGDIESEMPPLSFFAGLNGHFTLNDCLKHRTLHNFGLIEKDQVPFLKAM